MHDMLLTPLVKKQRTVQGCRYTSAAEAVRLVITTRWSLSSSVWVQINGTQGLFSDITFKRFQVILVAYRHS